MNEAYEPRHRDKERTESCSLVLVLVSRLALGPIALDVFEI